MKRRNEYLIVGIKKDDAVIKEMFCMVSVDSNTCADLVTYKQILCSTSFFCMCTFSCFFIGRAALPLCCFGQKHLPNEW